MVAYINGKTLKWNLIYDQIIKQIDALDGIAETREGMD
tara:strand:- start:435 stop:548 length:114 start_codon:yes stop_codon:yes gene_type:complete